MKKNQFLAFLLVCFISLSPTLYGQTKTSSTGNFDIISAGETITVRYSVANAYPDNLALQINPSASFVLNSHITDDKGNELIKIKQETVTGRYANSVDLSTLAPGSYFLEILPGNDQPAQRIAFTK